MDEITLLMSFENVSGDKTTLKIGGVKPDITIEEVEALGNHIIEKTIFKYKNSHLSKFLGAQVETKHVEIL